MKSSVCFVNTFAEDGKIKSVAIKDENENLKYTFLIDLAKENALVWDEQAKRAFLEIAIEYKRLRNINRRKTRM